MTTPNHSNRARTRAVRARMNSTGESYTQATRRLTDTDTDTDADAADETSELDGPAGPPEAGQNPPAIFDPSKVTLRSWDSLIERLDRCEEDLEDPDPYVRAHAFHARAGVYSELAAATTSDVYQAACYRSEVLDKSTAASIRFTAGIPTLFPRTETSLLGLNTCEWCGRPWQVSAEGACPHCPRLMFGPSPTSRADADRYARPVEAAPISSRQEIIDALAVAIETDGSGCDHTNAPGGPDDGACSTCLAEIALNALAELADHHAGNGSGPVTMRPDHP